MKSIHTLVEDIQHLFAEDNPHEVNPELVQEFGQRVAAKIASRLVEQRNGPGRLRMSNVGRGERQLWYEIKGYDAETEREELTPSNKIKFLFGDILEEMLIFLAKEAGHEVTHEQEKVELNGINGSTDCVIDDVVVDVKSASSFAFNKFKNHGLPDDDPFGYMEQLAGYSEALGKRNGAFLAIDKQLGHITLDYYPYAELERYNVPARIDYLKDVLEGDQIPERCYVDKEDGKSGNRVLGVNCSYCPFKKGCWSDTNNGVGLRTFLYSKGPVFFTKVEREPNVPEVTF